MAMVVHPRNDGEKKFLEGFYEGLKKRGIAGMSYSNKTLLLCASGLYFSIEPGDLIVLARNDRENTYLLSIYNEINKNPSKYESLPKFHYIDNVIIAMAKIKDKIVDLLNNE